MTSLNCGPELGDIIDRHTEDDIVGWLVLNRLHCVGHYGVCLIRHSRLSGSSIEGYVTRLKQAGSHVAWRASGVHRYADCTN